MNTNDTFTPQVWSGTLDALRWAQAHADRVMARWPEPEYEPVPWYGRLRQWLARPLFWLSERLDDASTEVHYQASRVHYRPKVKAPAIPRGTRINVRPMANLEPSTITVTRQQYGALNADGTWSVQGDI